MNLNEIGVMHESNNVAGNVGIFLTDISSVLSTMERQKKPFEDMYIFLLTIANLKIYVDNIGKIDKDKKILLKLLGYKTKKPLTANIINKMFKKRAVIKVNELIQTSGATSEKTANMKRAKEWIAEIRFIITKEELKIQDFLHGAT